MGRICENNGFERGIIERYNDHRVLDSFIDAFNYMPMAVFREQSTICTHGGISTDLTQPDAGNIRAEFSRINRPVAVPTDGLTHDLLWSNPIPEDDPTPLGWQPTRRRGFWFGHYVGNINGAHQYLQNGLRVFHGRLFSISQHRTTRIHMEM